LDEYKEIKTFTQRTFAMKSEIMAKYSKSRQTLPVIYYKSNTDPQAYLVRNERPELKEEKKREDDKEAGRATHNRLFMSGLVSTLFFYVYFSYR
jgi:hypothetical protein